MKIKRRLEKLEKKKDKLPDGPLLIKPGRNQNFLYDGKEMTDQEAEAFARKHNGALIDLTIEGL